MMGVAKTIAKTANSSEPVPVEPVQANGHEHERKWIAHNTQTSSSSIRSHGRDCVGATIRAQHARAQPRTKMDRLQQTNFIIDCRACF